MKTSNAWDEIVNPDTIAEYEDSRIDWDSVIKFDGDAIQTASGWDVFNNQDQFIGFVLDGELVELELSGLRFHKFPFRGFGRMS